MNSTLLCDDTGYDVKIIPSTDSLYIDERIGVLTKKVDDLTELVVGLCKVLRVKEAASAMTPPDTFDDKAESNE